VGPRERVLPLGLEAATLLSQANRF
jgi:hypothetical protein